MVSQGCKFTLSDDAHGPNDVGMHYEKLLEYVKSCGIHEVYCPGVNGNAYMKFEL